MKDNETIRKFIDLRSKGLSFARIAADLNVAKSTLIQWSHEHQHLIQNLRAIEWEDYVDHTLASKQERLKTLSDQLRRLDTELAQRDLATVSTAQLQLMADRVRRRLDLEGGSTLFSVGVDLSRDDETRQAIQDWAA